MAAKNKRTGRTGTSGDDGAAFGEHSSRGLHFRASQHREALLEEARALMVAGRIREARAVEKRAGQVGQLVGALETEVRGPVGGAADRELDG
jgi:hypothetical protein